LLGVLILIGLFIAYWEYAIPISIAGAVLIGVLISRNKRRASEAHEAWLKQQQEEHEAWLKAPPPPLPLPGRFTQKWIAANVPYLHPGQVPTLIEEFRIRGWSDTEIERRVEPYLPRETGLGEANPATS